LRLLRNVVPAFVGSAALIASTAIAQEPLEAGKLPASWPTGGPTCGSEEAFRIHEYNPDFVILRQSGCTNYEKPFLYLLFGARRALLFDTGAPGADVSGPVSALLRQWSARHHDRLPSLLAVHSHGHSDHTAGDAPLQAAGATVVTAKPDAVQRFFGITRWPDQVVTYDLGERVLDVIPIPGHEVASIALYDRRTGILLTGDTVYPGRLYVRDGSAFAKSIERLVGFTKGRPIAHVLGAHVENQRTPFADYPVGTKHQPDEHELALGRAHILELFDALRDMGDRVTRRALRDLTIFPVGN